MISSNPYFNFRSTVQAGLALEAGRTLRWKPIAESEAILSHLINNWSWAEQELTPEWLALKKLYSPASGTWDAAEAASSRLALKAFDLRLTVLIQQAWVRILFERKAQTK